MAAPRGRAERAGGSRAGSAAAAAASAPRRASCGRGSSRDAPAPRLPGELAPARGFAAVSGEDGWLGCSGREGASVGLEPRQPQSGARGPEGELGSETCSHEFWSCGETGERRVGRAERGRSSRGRGAGFLGICFSTAPRAPGLEAAQSKINRCFGSGFNLQRYSGNDLRGLGPRSATRGSERNELSPPVRAPLPSQPGPRVVFCTPLRSSRGPQAKPQPVLTNLGGLGSRPRAMRRVRFGPWSLGGDE